MLPVLTFYEPAPTWVLAVGLFVGLSVLVLTILRSLRVRGRAWWFLLLCWTPIGVLFVLSQWRPVYLERALLPAALFYLVCIAWLLTEAGLPKVVELAVALMLAVGCGGSLVRHFTYSGFPRPAFQQAVAYLAAEIEPGDRVVHTNKLTYFPMYVYAPNLSGVFLADPPGSPQDTLAYPTQEALGLFATPTVDEAMEGAKRLWLVYFLREVEEVEDSGGRHPVLERVGEDFILVDQRYFDDLVLARFERREE